jgi:hypothetical protein
MSIEVMSQALEALDEAANVLTSRMFADAAAALREAIEQAEQQEPVAWLYVNADMPTNRQLEWTEARQGYAGNWLKYPLCVAPPAAQSQRDWSLLEATQESLREHMAEIQRLKQRQWVGLTNEEIEAVMQGSVEGERMLPYQFARAIETKLKEKNETS